MSIESMLQMFRHLISEFSDIQDDEITYFLQLGDNRLSKRLCPSIRDEAIVYLAAHQLDLARKRLGSGGQVTSVSEGKLNIQYTHSSSLDSDYDYSNYGRRYKDLIRSCVVSVVTYTGCCR